MRASWEALGWTAEAWDGEAAAPPSEQMDWAELSAAQQGAALELGYSESTWGEAWGDLEPEVRVHWETLGWSEASWAKRARAPATESMAWQLLDGAQRDAAQALGYTPETWAAASSAPEDSSLSHSEERRVRAIFDQTDTDKSGLLDEEEISAMLLQMGKKLSKAERNRVMADMKRDGGTGDVDYGDFRVWYLEQVPRPTQLPLPCPLQRLSPSMCVSVCVCCCLPAGRPESVHAACTTRRLMWRAMACVAARCCGCAQGLAQQPWGDLTREARAHWQILGWDEASWSGAKAAPATERMDWSELTLVRRCPADHSSRPQPPDPVSPSVRAKPGRPATANIVCAEHSVVPPVYVHGRSHGGSLPRRWVTRSSRGRRRGTSWSRACRSTGRHSAGVRRHGAGSGIHRPRKTWSGMR
eukprot:COSAG01_NODE_41_length_32446_cov_41.218877_36_plen_414_part_00